jgi:hypothetical protein
VDVPAEGHGRCGRGDGAAGGIRVGAVLARHGLKPRVGHAVLARYSIFLMRLGASATRYIPKTNLSRFWREFELNFSD